MAGIMHVFIIEVVVCSGVELICIKLRGVSILFMSTQEEYTLKTVLVLHHC